MMEILLPVFAMALLTFAVAPVALVARINSVKDGFVRIKYYELFVGSEPPENVIKTTRHLSNLHEAPILFYVACLMAFSLQIESVLLVGLAWGYVAIRLVHTIIHLTYNRVFHRMMVFLASQILLIVMWVLLFLQVI
jgi:hypothetical protein